MKINILGGGPAGLYFAILMKTLSPEHDVQVFERNPQGNTFGWGVVFSDRTLGYLEQSDSETHRVLQSELRMWENVDIVHRDELISVAGNRFAGVARLQLLRVLQERCKQLDVPVTYHHECSDPREYLGADLLVGADGVHSQTRSRLTNVFQPRLGEGKNRYIWFGTRQPFGGLTLIFRPCSRGLFMAHAYKYSEELSTFIVEVDEATWSEHVRHWSDAETLQHLQEVFSSDLGGHPLLSNASKWIRFSNVRNEKWWGIVENTPVVLLGDALHTAHFSIGSGTKLAMEDSIALRNAFASHRGPAAALEAFERERRPAVEKLQGLAETSQHWFESAAARMHMSALELAYEAMTRSSKIDQQNLQRRDPAFVRRYEEFLRERTAP
jgi:anthraniloyl-CoA monooxygenase